MTIWFTSDTHFWHSNIIRYCDRPFTDAQAMNEKLIRNWNRVVQPEDTVYHLGDVIFADEDMAYKVLSQLNGKKHLIWGNHDKVIQKSPKLQSLFESFNNLLEVYIQDSDASKGRQHIVLCHYAMLVWNKSHHGSWMLHGHSHNTLQYPFKGKILDVGVDGHDFTPVSYANVKKHMAAKEWTPVDQHT